MFKPVNILILAAILGSSLCFAAGAMSGAAVNNASGSTPNSNSPTPITQPAPDTTINPNNSSIPASPENPSNVSNGDKANSSGNTITNNKTGSSKNTNTGNNGITTPPN